MEKEEGKKLTTDLLFIKQNYSLFVCLLGGSVLFYHYKGFPTNAQHYHGRNQVIVALPFTYSRIPQWLNHFESQTYQML